MFSYEDIFSKKQKILIVTAHPDDSLVFFGALMNKLCSDGKEVYVLVVTNGARGSRENNISESELALLRVKEEKAALTSLGVSESNIFCLDYLDGEVESDMKLIGEIAKYIRKFKIDIVCTHEPSQQYIPAYSKQGFFVQHRDHRKTGEAVIDAVYPFSRDRSFFTHHYLDGIEPHSVFDILLTDENACNFALDISEQVEIKKRAMQLHKSQFDEETIGEIITAFTFEGKPMERFNYLKLLW
ncbi:MAG TPA: PIG-L deacetylase family protein [Patescibacteria group bacterium]|nr:PIG-L deacetylase family protein [Patescibacteria group bacterium]